MWLAWHVAALQRMKKLPDIKRMMLSNTSRRRQSWREQQTLMNEWATQHNAWLLAREKAKSDGR